MKYTQRIFFAQFDSEPKLDRLINFLSQHRSLCDEISFFTESDGCDWRFLPCEEISRRAEIVAMAVKKARNAGFTPVINLHNTLGHSDDGGSDALAVPWRGMVDINGATARQCSCPADPDFLSYLRFKYTSYAQCHAERYWIDDDLRLSNHMPVRHGCFCPFCLNEFSQEYGQRFDRNTLISAWGQNREIRSAWVKRNGRMIDAVLKLCVDSIRDVCPDAEIGLMATDLVDLADVDVDFRRWFDLLASPEGVTDWLRPGGGFWDDYTPRQVLHKVHSVNHTVDALPPGVKSTYEVENYPYTNGSKSAVMTGLECLLATLTGKFDGIMFDMLDFAGNSLDSYNHWTTQLQLWQSRWEQADELSAGTVTQGWKPAFTLRHFQQYSRPIPSGEIPYSPYRQTLSMANAGIPMTSFDSGTLGHLLCGNVAAGMTRQELIALLAQPLLMDGDAATRYLEEELGDKIGITGLSVHQSGVYERFSTHQLNGSDAGYLRAATNVYYNLTSYALTLMPQAESLSSLLDYGARELGSSFSLYRPHGGTPVAVIGHMPWIHLLSPQRMRQLRHLSAMLLDANVPVAIESNQAVAWWFGTGHGRAWLAVFNPGFDPADVRILSPSESPTLALGSSCHACDDGVYFIPGWETAVFTLSH